MSSILDALNKLEEEKAQARRDAEGVDIDPEVAAQELVGASPWGNGKGFSLTPARLMALALVTVVLLLVITVGVLVYVVQRVTEPAGPSADSVATAPPTTLAMSQPDVVEPDLNTSSPAEGASAPVPPVAAPAEAENASAEPSPPVQTEGTSAPVAEAEKTPTPAPEPSPAPVETPPEAAPVVAKKPEPTPEPEPKPAVEAKAPDPEPELVAEAPQPQSEPAPLSAAIPSAPEPQAEESQPPVTDAVASAPVDPEPTTRYRVARDYDSATDSGAGYDAGDTESATSPAPIVSKPVDIRSYPFFAKSVQIEYGITKFRLNMTNTDSSRNPFPFAVITIKGTEKYMENSRIENTRLKLFKVAEYAIVLEDMGSGQRYYYSER
jgi:hypothetical protein